MNAAGMSSLRERCKSEQRWEEEKEEDKTRGSAVARDETRQSRSKRFRTNRETARRLVVVKMTRGTE